MIATFVKAINKEQALFKLSPPITYEYWDVNSNATDPIMLAEYVISSKTLVFGTPETYLFHADSNGEFIHMMELPGSLKEVYNVVTPLKELGYTVALPEAYQILYEQKEKL